MNWRQRWRRASLAERPELQPDPRTLAPPVPPGKPPAVLLGLGSRPGGLGYHGPAYLPVRSEIPIEVCPVCGRPGHHSHDIELRIGGRRPGLYVDGMLITLREYSGSWHFGPDPYPDPDITDSDDDIPGQSAGNTPP